jgi:hypothetical protein
MTADHRVGQVDIFDDGFQFASVMFGHLTSKEGGDLVGLINLAVGVEQTLTECVQRSAPVEHEIVVILYLGKEQPMLAAMVLAFVFGEERREAGQPLLAAGQQIFGRQRISHLLQTLRGRCISGRHWNTAESRSSHRACGWRASDVDSDRLGPRMGSTGTCERTFFPISLRSLK